MNKKRTVRDEQRNYIDVLTETLDAHRPLFTAGTTEFALISVLQDPPYSLFDKTCLKQPSDLFKTHFLLFHCLYKLKHRYQAAQLGDLHIHTTEIKLHAMVHNPHSSAFNSNKLGRGELVEGDKLAHYYLDLDNLAMSDDEVETLLDSFWRRFAQGTQQGYSECEIYGAKQTLSIPDETLLSEDTIKRYYRKALQLHHPDKGGCSLMVQKVIHAYQVLRHHHSTK